MAKTVIMIDKPDGTEIKVPEANVETMKARGWIVKDDAAKIVQLDEPEGGENDGES